MFIFLGDIEENKRGCFYWITVYILHRFRDVANYWSNFRCW